MANRPPRPGCLTVSSVSAESGRRTAHGEDLNITAKHYKLGAGLLGILILAGWTLLYALYGQYGGVELEFYLNRQAEGQAVLERKAARIAYHRARQFAFHPKGGDFSMRAKTYLIPERSGEYSLAAVSLGSTRLSLAERSKWQTSLNKLAFPQDWQLASSPAGEVHLATDRVLATRFSTGRPKREGDSLSVKFPREQTIHGVVMDSAPSGMRDCPLRFLVKTRDREGNWSQKANVNVPSMRASTVDALFSPQKARALKVELKGSHDHFFWSVHELHVISNGLLDQLALKTRLSGPTPLQLTYLPPAEEIPGGPGSLQRDYGLLLLFWKPPGKDWRLVPAQHLSLAPQDGFWAALARHPLAGRLLPWLWALMLALGLALTLKAWRGGGHRADTPEQAPGPGQVRARRLALALLGVLALVDLMGWSSLFGFWSTLLFGPLVEPGLAVRGTWAAVLLGLGLLAFLLTVWPKPRRLWPGGGFAWAAGGLLMLQLSLGILWMQALGWQSPLSHLDHGAFLYAHSIWDQFPYPLIHYNPFWNGGIEEWEPVRNGSFAAYALARPLTWFWPLSKAYTLFIPLIFGLILPWTIFFSLRSLGASRPGALLAALTGLIPHTNWVYWVSTGASAGLLSAGLSLPALAAFWRLSQNRGNPWLNALAGAAAFSLALVWMPFVFAATLPCLALLIIHARDLRGRRLWGLLLMALLILGAGLPWVLDFAAKFKVLSFAQQSMHLPELDPGRMWRDFYGQLGEFNPLLLIPGLMGLAWLKPKKRWFMAGYVVYLLALIELVAQYMPNYQLNRMQQFLAIALTIPAAFLWNGFKDRPGSSPWLRGLAYSGLVMVVALQIAGALNFYSVSLEKRSPETAPAPVMALANWLSRPGAPAGRILLAGQTDKQYGGCAAYLQMLTRKQMIADYHVGTLQRNLEVKLPPELCRTPPAPGDFKRLLRLYNVTQVVKDIWNPKDPWNRYLKGLAWLQPEKLVDGHYQVYLTGVASSYVLQGEARVKAALNRIRVWPRNEAPLVLKYRYVTGLRASNGVKLTPREVWPRVDFIACDGHRGQLFEIVFR
jgi:hypothetical protein